MGPDCKMYMLEIRELQNFKIAKNQTNKVNDLSTISHKSIEIEHTDLKLTKISFGGFNGCYVLNPKDISMLIKKVNSTKTKKALQI